MDPANGKTTAGRKAPEERAADAAAARGKTTVREHLAASRAARELGRRAREKMRAIRF